jgi:pimeloyl-ACP methyl ester carboxylesterase
MRRTYLNAHVGWIARSTLGTGRRAHLSYLLGTPFHPLVHFLALHLVRSFPREIVEDSFKNTWESYTRTLAHCIFDHDLTPALAALTNLPILALHGTHDSSAPLEKVTALAARMPNVRLETLPGDHHILLEQNGACIAAIDHYIDAVTMRERRGVSPSRGRKRSAD